jgi:hypothetical protein
MEQQENPQFNIMQVIYLGVAIFALVYSMIVLFS